MERTKTMHLKKLLVSMKTAKTTLETLTSKEKSHLEKEWDIEHAYYSSALEGSRLSHKDFEALAKKVS